MANQRYNTQIRNRKEPTTGKGVFPLKGMPQWSHTTTSHPSWPGLPGPSGPDRSNGTPEEKVYAYAQGIRGGVDDD